VDRVTESLIEDGYSAAAYHAGLSPTARTCAQDDFLHDRVKIIVATNAFGMGIDKSNVRFVIHYNMPQNVEAYYQEAGRAGRDGLPADCILFFARKDISTVAYLILQSGNSEEIRRNRRLLDKIEEYCNTENCLRNYLLEYFGEGASDDCGSCGNCIGMAEEPEISKKSRVSAKKFAFSDPLFEKLKAARLEIARHEKVPAFVVFSDATLVDMCQKHPLTPDEFLNVSGVGQVKLERYGDKFLEILRNEERRDDAHPSPPSLTSEILMNEVVIESELLQITCVADNINAVLLKRGSPKISGMALNKLLLKNDYLEDTTGTKLPTQKGKAAGITTVRRNSRRGEYDQCLFDANAQRLCVSLVDVPSP